MNSLRLTELAGKVGTFKTPLQVTVPFTIPLFIQLQDYKLNEDFVKAMTALDLCAMWKIPLERDKVLAILKEIYSKPEVLDSIVVEVQNSLSSIRGSMVAVRSSSTLEDLKKMAGAGLFDSVLNVELASPEAMKKAIVEV